MNIIQQVGHVIAKDVRRMQWVIAGIVVTYLVSVFATHFPLVRHVGPVYLLWFAVAATLFVVPMFLVQEDSPASVTSFWRTRPLSPVAMLLAKLILCISSIVLPLMIGQYAAIAWMGGSVADATPYVLKAAGWHGAVVLSAVAISAGMRNIRTALLLMFGLMVLAAVVMVSAPDTYMSLRESRPAFLAVAVIVSLAGITLLYFQVNGRVGRVVSAFGVLVLLMFSIPLSVQGEYPDSKTRWDSSPLVFSDALHVPDTISRRAAGVEIVAAAGTMDWLVVPYLTAHIGQSPDSSRGITDIYLNEVVHRTSLAHAGIDSIVGDLSLQPRELWTTRRMRNAEGTPNYIMPMPGDTIGYWGRVERWSPSVIGRYKVGKGVVHSFDHHHLEFSVVTDSNGESQVEFATRGATSAGAEPPLMRKQLMPTILLVHPRQRLAHQAQLVDVEQAARTALFPTVVYQEHRGRLTLPESANFGGLTPQQWLEQSEVVILSWARRGTFGLYHRRILPTP